MANRRKERGGIESARLQRQRFRQARTGTCKKLEGDSACRVATHMSVTLTLWGEWIALVVII